MGYDFTRSAEEFLQNTDTAYDECASGISELDRIIVGCPSALADRTRGYLVVCLYAFWERFFRVAFGEYFRCIGLVKLDLGDAQEDLGRNWLRQQLSSFTKRNGIKTLPELASHHTPSALRQLLEGFVSDLKSPLQFSTPSDWVETESNVRFKVLERHCKRCGIDFGAIKSDFDLIGSLFARIEKFVADRNDVAHGSQIPSISQVEWESTRSFVLKLLQSVQFELYRTLHDGKAQLGANAQGDQDYEI